MYCIYLFISDSIWQKQREIERFDGENAANESRACILDISFFFLTAAASSFGMSIPWALLKVCVNSMMMICVLLVHKQTLHRHLHGLEKSITNALCCIKPTAVTAALSLTPINYFSAGCLRPSAKGVSAIIFINTIYRDWRIIIIRWANRQLQAK